jgi:hypothetical protein
MCIARYDFAEKKAKKKKKKKKRGDRRRTIAFPEQAI